MLKLIALCSVFAVGVERWLFAVVEKSKVNSALHLFGKCVALFVIITIDIIIMIIINRCVCVCVMSFNDFMFDG